MAGTTRYGSVIGAKIDKEDTVRVAIHYLGSDRLCQVGLPRPAGTGEGHEADIVLRQEVGQRRHLGLPPDQACGRKRERRRHGRASARRGYGRHLRARRG